MSRFCINKTNLKLLDYCIYQLENIIEKNLSLELNSVKIYNDPKKNYCWYSTDNDNKAIYLSIKDETIEQIIFQLSHELMHHIIYQVEDKTLKCDGKESKAQETLCTAFSFFALKELGFDEYLKNEILDLMNNKAMYSKYKNEIMDLYNILVNKTNALELLIDECVRKWNKERGIII